MNYKLIAADMDGTLLDDNSILTKRTEIALKAAVNSGVLFVASTGRPMCGVEALNELFDVDLPFIIFNGAAIITGKSRNVLYSSVLAADYVKEVYNLGMSRNVPIVLWVGEKLFVSGDCEAIRDYQKISYAPINIIRDIDEVKDLGASKLLWIAPPEDITRYQDEMNRHFGGRINCHASRPYMLEFVNAEASKGRALEKIGKVYGIDKSEMIAVGDGYNDLSMLEYAGLGVAMQNAPDDIKSLCQYVTLSNNDNGVAAVIDKFILNFN